MSPEELLPLKPNWFHILLSLAAGEQHGYAIMQQVAERTGGKIRLWPATLYGAIKQLVEADLIEECAAGGDDDPRRRNYRLTRFGKRVLAAESERLRGLVKLLDETAGWQGAR